MGNAMQRSDRKQAEVTKQVEQAIARKLKKERNEPNTEMDIVQIIEAHPGVDVHALKLMVAELAELNLGKEFKNAMSKFHRVLVEEDER